MKRTAFAIGALVVLAFGAWWSTRVPSVSTERARVDSAHDADATQLPAQGAGERTGTSVSLELTPNTLEHAREVVARAASSTPVATVRLIVVARREVVPVPGAHVYVFDTQRLGERDPEFRALGPDHAAGPWPADTRHFLADGEGRVQLPAPDGSVSVVVFAPGRAGKHVVLGNTRSPVTVKLDDVFYARVVDERGSPVAGASVRLGDVRFDSKSDELGRVWFELTTPPGERVPDELRLSLVRPLSTPLDIVLQRRVRDDVRQDIVLPTEGTLRIETSDAASVLGVSSGSVVVHRTELVKGRGRHAPGASAPLEDGHAVIRSVPIGVELAVSVGFDGVAGWFTERIVGPRQLDEVLVHDVRVSAHALSRLQLLGADSRPLAATDVSTLCFTTWGGGPTTEKTRTDSEGRFLALLDAIYARGNRPVLELWIGGTKGATVALPSERWTGIRDLGAVQLESDGESPPAKAKTSKHPR